MKQPYLIGRRNQENRLAAGRAVTTQQEPSRLRAEDSGRLGGRGLQPAGLQTAGPCRVQRLQTAGDRMRPKRKPDALSVPVFRH
ncbi:hypothetical protein JKG47_17595 [Acidithiobacillus sp. MC6.1]|nr:hypothetical protein [Acidithiobacillus sp. MC6.1]